MSRKGDNTEKSLTVLFTCVGRRVELLQTFQSAAYDLGIILRIIGVDSSTTASALAFCNKIYQICRISDPDYIPSLKRICIQENVKLVIPTIDTDLLVLSKERDAFLGIGSDILVSDPDKIALCRDKMKTSVFLKSCGVKTPNTVDTYKSFTGQFPCFIKPKDGSASINAFKIENDGALAEKAKLIKDYVIQSYIEGTEYTVDIFCDFQGNPVHIVPRKRLQVRSGEVLVTEIVEDDAIVADCQKIIKKFKPRGPLAIQLIRDKRGDDYYIEINPRFGGGCPLSMKSGHNSAKTLLKLLNQDEYIAEETGAFPRTTILSRFDQSVVVAKQDSIPSFSNYNQLMSIIEGMHVEGIVFDLDDTLYAEKDYVRSGLLHLSENEEAVYGCFDKMWNYYKQGKLPIDAVLKERSCYSDSTKTKLLLSYRSHHSTISLYPEALNFIRMWKDADSHNKLGMITDGRVEGQNNKIDALGIRSFFDEIIVTDELAGKSGNVMRFRKPNKISFEIMRERLGLDYYKVVYVGDNPQKDFATPLALGMHVIRFLPSDGVWV